MRVRSYYLEYEGVGEKDAAVWREGWQESKEKTHLFAAVYRAYQSCHSERSEESGLQCQVRKSRFIEQTPPLGMTTIHDLEGWPVTKRFFDK